MAREICFDETVAIITWRERVPNAHKKALINAAAVRELDRDKHKLAPVVIMTAGS